MNNIYYAVLLLMMALLFIFRLKINKGEGYDSLDRETTNVLKGYSIVLIMIHHMVLRMSHPGILLPFRLVGYLGVSVFFFLSGYGLVCAANNREKTYSKGFMIKRIEKIYIPAMFAQVLYMLVLLLAFNQKYTSFSFIKGALTLYPVDTSQWYIIVLFFWYFSFWILIKTNDSWKRTVVVLFVLSLLYIIVCLLLDMPKNWVDTSFCFPLGVAFSVYREKCFKLLNKYSILLPVVGIMFAITVFFSYGKETLPAVATRAVSTLFFLTAILMMLKYIDVSKNNIVGFIGISSLEFYLIHGKVIRVVKLTFGDVKVMEMIIYLVSTAIIAIGFRYIIKKYNSFIRKIRINRKAPVIPDKFV